MSRKSRRSKRNPDRRQQREDRGHQQLKEDIEVNKYNDHWDLDWFEPRGLQEDCSYSVEHNTFTIIDSPSGCGKTTIALWCGLHELKDGNVDQLLFIKNPTEVGDDKIGYLSGGEDDKLSAHMHETKRIFHSFMHKNKLENDIKNEKIRLTIPNFVLGSTWDNTFIIIDEAQLMSPATVKLLLERCGQNTKYCILGDSGQRYAVSKRQDGLADLIERVTEENVGIMGRDSGKRSKYPGAFGYIRMSRHDNQRSEGSKLINQLYEDT